MSIPAKNNSRFFEAVFDDEIAPELRKRDADRVLADLAQPGFVVSR